MSILSFFIFHNFDKLFTFFFFIYAFETLNFPMWIESSSSACFLVTMSTLQKG